MNKLLPFKKGRKPYRQIIGAIKQISYKLFKNQYIDLKVKVFLETVRNFGYLR